MTYIKNAFRYIGAKDKLLSQIGSHIPKDKDYLIDLFGGSGVMTANFGQYFNKVYYNEKSWQVTAIQKWLYNAHYPVQAIEDIIDIFDLNKINKDNYLEAREYYNTSFKTKEEFYPALLYSIIMHSFNSNIVFNSKKEYNVPFGKNRSDFNANMQIKLKEYINAIKCQDIEFYDYDFEEFYEIFQAGEPNYSKYFFYIDPPYFNSDQSYARTKELKWDEAKELALYKMLDELSELGVQWLLSNTVINNGNENKILANWMSKYNVVEVESSYKNKNYQRKNIGVDREVLIKNY